MTPAEIAALCVAGIAAGAINSIAGGGTVITFPVLLAFGLPAIQANATSTLALVLGIVGSAYGYRAHLPAARHWLARFGLVSVVGGLIGAFLLTRTNEAAFSRLAPFLLLFATVLFMAQKTFRRLAVIETTHPHHFWLALALQFLVAVYGGYFGAGIGILMLAVFGLLGMRHIHEMNTLKTILGASINLIAAGYFIFAGLIRWPEALVMTAGSTVGYFTGARLAQRISQAQVRSLITAIGLIISALLFWKQFMKS